MLNTDLHNAAVQPKITAQQYSDSCRRCAPLRRRRVLFLDIYRNISRRPSRSLAAVLRPRGVDHVGGGRCDRGALRRMASMPRRRPRSRVTAPCGRGPARRGGSHDCGCHTRRGAAAEASVGQRGVKVDWSVAYWNRGCGCYAKASVALRWTSVPFRARRWAELYGTVAVIALSYASAKPLSGGRVTEERRELMRRGSGCVWSAGAAPVP